MNLLDGLKQQKIEEKKKMGRPTTYKEEYCDMVVEHMKSGLSVESFAAKIETHKDTIYEWIKVHPEFSDSVKRGYAKSTLFWETIGIQGTAGKLKGFNSKSWEFNMQNRFKETWKIRHDVTTDDKKIESPMVYIPQEREDL